MIKKHTIVSLKFITSKNIKFEYLFTLPPPGLELYFIELSFFEKGSFYFRLEHGKWEMHRDIIAQEQLNASVTWAKLNFTTPGFEVLGRRGRKEDRPGRKKEEKRLERLMVRKEFSCFYLPDSLSPHNSKNSGSSFISQCNLPQLR